MLIDPTHQILTKRCRLRYPHQKDIPHIWSATRVPGFNDGMLWDSPKHLSELDAPLVRNHKSWAQGDAFTFSIDGRGCDKHGRDKDGSGEQESDERGSDEFIGRISIRREDQSGEWSIGFWVHPSAQGHGYATEAAHAIVAFGFDQLSASVLSAAHATWNEASGKILTNIGMTKVRFNPKGFKKHGKWVEEFEYKIERSA